LIIIDKQTKTYTYVMTYRNHKYVYLINQIKLSLLYSNYITRSHRN